MTQSTAERALKAWLVLGGVVLGAALVSVAMPFGWMDAVHRWMDLGPLPEAGIVEYLARTVSAMYAAFGGLLLVCATNPSRFAPIVTYSLTVLALVAIGMLMLMALNRPELVPWIALDGVPASIYSVVGLLLQRVARVGPGSMVV